MAGDPRASELPSDDDGRVDVLIIGGGLAGLAAARRAHGGGKSVAVVTESPGSLPYTSGALDLLSVYPTETKRYRDHPWEALAELIEREPDHPYARVGIGPVREAWNDFLDYLVASPLAYQHLGDRNQAIVTPAGTLKPTFALPATLASNAVAWAQHRPTAIVGFEGLPDFSPEQVVGNLRPRWPGLRAIRLPTSQLLGEERRPTTAVLAAEFERAEFRRRFCELVAPELDAAQFVGLPSVLGYARATENCLDLAHQLGVGVFEIPLLSPSHPGMRLAELLKADLWRAGVTVWQGAPIDRVDDDGRRIRAVWRRGRTRPQRLEADAFLLATGRFFGGGLEATPRGVRECVVGLPIDVPFSRDDWHMGTFLGAPGHPINRVGVQVDPSLRPLDAGGRPRFDNLFAAGALLAGHDWVREKSGAGISVTTGYAAIDAALASL